MFPVAPVAVVFVIVVVCAGGGGGGGGGGGLRRGSADILSNGVAFAAAVCLYCVRKVTSERVNGKLLLLRQSAAVKAALPKAQLQLPN